MSGARQKNKRAERRDRIVAFGGGRIGNRAGKGGVMMREQDGKGESPDYITYVERELRERRIFARWAEFGTKCLCNCGYFSRLAPERPLRLSLVSHF